MLIGAWGLAYLNLQDFGGRGESRLARDRTTYGLADFDFSLTNVSQKSRYSNPASDDQAATDTGIIIAFGINAQATRLELG